MSTAYLFGLQKSGNDINLRIDTGWSYFDFQGKDQAVTIHLVNPDTPEHLIELLGHELGGVILYEIIEDEYKPKFTFESEHAWEWVEFDCADIKVEKNEYSVEELLSERKKIAQQLSESQTKENEESRKFNRFITQLSSEIFKECDKNKRITEFFLENRPEKAEIAAAKAEAYQRVTKWIEVLKRDIL